MNVALLIATAGRPDLLGRTLHSLAECEQPEGYAGAIVAENGPADTSRGVVESAPAALRARYLHLPEPNKSAALNAAMELAGDCLAIMTDDDMRFAPNFLCAYAEAAQAAGPGYFFGGPLSADYESPPQEWLRPYLPLSVRGWDPDPGAAVRPGKKMKFLGGNWAAHTRDLKNVGGFDANLGPGSIANSTGEETDMQVRLEQAGIEPRFVPGARVWHYIPAERCSPGWAIKRVYRHGVQEGLMAERNGRGIVTLPPWWATKNYLVSVARAWKKSVFTSPEARFQSRHRCSYDRGLLIGLAMPRR